MANNFKAQMKQIKKRSAVSRAPGMPFIGARDLLDNKQPEQIMLLKWFAVQ